MKDFELNEILDMAIHDANTDNSPDLTHWSNPNLPVCFGVRAYPYLQRLICTIW